MTAFCSEHIQQHVLHLDTQYSVGAELWPSRGEKLDLAKICTRAKQFANLMTKFAVNLHACKYHIGNHQICSPVVTKFAREQI
jgi:hypothetical protein